MNFLERLRLLLHIIRWRFTWSKKDLDCRPKGAVAPKFITAREAAALIPGTYWQKAETLAALIQRFHHPVDDVRRLLWHAERTGAPLPRSTRQVFRIIAID